MFFIVSWLIVTIPHAKRIETAEPPITIFDSAHNLWLIAYGFRASARCHSHLAKRIETAEPPEPFTFQRS